MKKIVTFIFLLLFSIAIIGQDADSGNRLNTENEKSPEVLIYPNPAKGSKVFVKGKNIQDIEVLSPVGHRIFTSKNEESKKKVELSLEKCQTGVYLVKITFDDANPIVQKLLVK